jgi:hypothetical protein
MPRFRLALVAFALTLAPSAAWAQEPMNAASAISYIAGRHFAYRCFDGTHGAGRILADGSGFGSIRPGGQGPLRFVQLPTGTLYVSGEKICARLRGLPWDPCFNLTRTSASSFRGAISGLGWMYCDFTHHTRRPRRASQGDGMIAGAAAPQP